MSRRLHIAISGVALAALLAGAAPARAQVSWFGKNKVQHRNLEWRILRTPHFDVHFTDGYRDLAARTGFILEYGYEKLSIDFGHHIDWRIPVIIYGSQSDFQETNVTWSLLPEGVLAFSEPTRRRIVIYFGGSSSEYANTAIHELVHIFTFDIVYGNLLKSVFSRSRLFAIPLWFAEGLAEYYSVGWEESGEMFMRDAAVFDYLPDLEYAGGYMAYKAGQAALRYLNETYGSGKVIEIMESMRSGSLGAALQSSLGITPEELSRDWKKAIRKRYWPLYADKKEPEAYGRRLTDHFKKHHYMNVKPVFSPDGEYIVYFSDLKGLDGIYLMNALTGKVEKRLITGMMSSRFESVRSMNSSLTYSPAGDRIAFVAKSGGIDKLFIQTVPGGKVVEELPLPLDFFHSPAWSPDGSSIALVGVKHGQTDLYLLRLSSKELLRITDDPDDETNPGWFPDGTRIVYVRSALPVAQPSFEADSTGAVRLAGDDFAARRPMRPTDSDIWSVDWTTGEQRLLVQTPGDDTNPVVLADGKELLFTSDEIGISNLYRGSLETGGYYRFTDVLGGIFSFSYSPAKDRLVMSAFSQAGYDLFMMDEFGNKSKESYSTGGPLMAAGSDRSAAAAGEGDSPLPAGMRAEARDTTDRGAADRAESVGTAGEVLPGPSAGAETAHPLPLGPGETILRERRGDRKAPDIVVDEDSKDNIDPDTLEAIRSRVAKEVGTIQPYRLKLAPDYIGDMASVYFFSGYGLGLMNQIAFSDLLGDHHLYIAFNIYQSIEDSDIQVTYYYVKKRIDYAVGAFQYKNYLNSRVTSLGETFRDYRLFTERNYGLAGLMSYPFSTFTRVDLDFEGFVSEREFFGFYRESEGGYLYYYVPKKSTRYVLQPALSIVHDSAYWGRFGPVIGSRWLASISRTLPIFDDTVDRFSFYYDYRKYLPIFYRNYLVFRSMGAASNGDDRRSFFLGGPQTMRGYDYLQFSGSRMLLFSLEYRYPLVDAVIFGWPGRWGFTDIGGSLFIDSGAVWGEDRYIDQTPSVESRRVNDVAFYSDFGLGFHMRFGYLVLNFQWGWPTDFSDTGRSAFHFYIGPLF